MKIKFNIPRISDNAQEYLNEVLYKSGLDSDKFCKKSTELLEKATESKQVLLTHSCTAALEMAAILIDIKPGDEVIMPSYTFVSTANAFVLRGGVPVFVDIREDTLNIDEKLITEAITPRTKAIVPVHYAGVGCEMDVIMEIAKKHNLYVIEDAAQCIGAKYKGKHLGTIGHLGTLSFHSTKNITSSHGGALLVNEEKFFNRSKIIWQKGTNRELFLQGKVDKYTWVDMGSSFMMSELSAALLYSQLELLEIITTKRLNLWGKYYECFKDLEKKDFFVCPKVPEMCQHNAHIFYLIFSSKEIRDSIMSGLKINGVSASFHYIPLHTTNAAKLLGNSSIEKNLPISDRLSGHILRLPLYPSLTSENICSIVTKITKLLTQR